MSVLYVAVGVIVALLAAYLIVALIAPERFE